MNERKKRRGAGFRIKPWSPSDTKIGIKTKPLNLGKPTNISGNTNLFGNKGQKPSWFTDKVWKTEVVTKDEPEERSIRQEGSIRQQSKGMSFGRPKSIAKKVDFFGGQGRKPSWFNNTFAGKDSDYDGVPDRKDCNPRNSWLQDDDKGRIQSNFKPATRVPTGENFEDDAGEEFDEGFSMQDSDSNLPTIYEPQNVEEAQQQPIQNVGETGLQEEKEFVTYNDIEPSDSEPEMKTVGGDFVAQEEGETTPSSFIDNDSVDVPENEPMWYLYYRLEDGKWYLDNAYEESELQAAFQRLENYPGIVETRVSKENILKQLNRQLGLKNVGDTLSKTASKVGDYTERQQFKGNVQQQLQGTKQNYQRQQSRPRRPQSRPQLRPQTQPQTQPNINIYQQERRLPPNGNGVGRVQQYSPVTARQSTVPRTIRQYQAYGANQAFQNPNYDMGVKRKVRRAPGLHKPNPMSINLSNSNAGTGLGQKRKGSPVTRPKFMIPMGDIKFLRFGRRLE